jgi:Bacterial Ig-like domain (group 3)
MSTILPIAAPFTTPLGQVVAGGGPPATYAGAWFRGPQEGAQVLVVNNTDIIGVVGPATLAYMKAQGFTYGALVPSVTGGLAPSSGAVGTEFLTTVNPVMGGPTPTGTVQYFIDAQTTPVTSATLSNGFAGGIITPAMFPSLGNHTVTAVYLGDRNYTGASSSPQPFDNQGQPTFVSLRVNGNSSPFSIGHPLPLTFVMTLGGFTVAPIGNIQLWTFPLAGGGPNLLQTVGPMVSIGGGQYTATFNATSGPPGSYVSGSFFAIYEGDGFYVSLNSSNFTGGFFTLTVT